MGVGSTRTDIIRVLPLESNLQIVVVVHQIQEPLQQVLALFLGHAINVRHVSADGENALPPGHRVGSHNGVNGLELAADVFRSAARLVV